MNTAIEVSNFFTTSDQLYTFSNYMDIVGIKEAFIGCTNWTEAAIFKGTQEVAISNSYECMYTNTSDPSYLADPCCSYSSTQCCAKRNFYKNTSVVTGVDGDYLTASCNSPSQVEAIILQAGSAFNQKSLLDSYDQSYFGDFYDNYIDFIYNTDYKKTCYYLISKSCKKDNECPYSGKCAGSGAYKYCYVDWTNPTPTLLACYLDKMKPELLTVLQDSLGIETGLNRSTLAAGMTSAITQKFATDTCSGPTSYDHSARYDWTLDDAGSWTRVKIPGNQTGCLVEKECSVEPYLYSDEASCISTPPFCESCDLYVLVDYWVSYLILSFLL